MTKDQSSKEIADFLRNYIHGLKPSIFGLATIDSIKFKPLATGHHNINFQVEINKQKKFVARYNPDSKTAEKMRREYNTLLRVNGEHGPRAIHFESNKKSILIMEFVDGEEKNFNKLSESEIKHLSHAVVDIHIKTFNKFSAAPGFAAEHRGTNYDFFTSMCQETITNVLKRSNPQIYKKDLDVINIAQEKLKLLIKMYKKAFTGRTFSLCHMDLIPSNTRWMDKEITFIDWEFSAFGDRANDIANLFAVNNLSHNFEQVFLKDYKKHIADSSFDERLFVHYLRNRIDDLVWAIGKIDDEEKGNNLLTKKKGFYKKHYNIRLKALKSYLAVLEKNAF